MKTNAALDPKLPVVVCALATTPLLYPDNLSGVCRVCEALIQHRPHIPRPSQLVCVACFDRLADETDDFGVTGPTIRELERQGPLLSMWTIFKHPADFPRHYVVRRFLMVPGRPAPVPAYVAGLYDTLKEARADCQRRAELVFRRSPDDDPNIVESWMR